jgi:hypothetical protein
MSTLKNLDYVISVEGGFRPFFQNVSLDLQNSVTLNLCENMLYPLNPYSNQKTAISRPMQPYTEYYTKYYVQTLSRTACLYLYYEMTIIHLLIV